jgi:hypothetical protein
MRETVTSSRSWPRGCLFVRRVLLHFNRDTKLEEQGRLSAIEPGDLPGEVGADALMRRVLRTIGKARQNLGLISFVRSRVVTILIAACGSQRIVMSDENLMTDDEILEALIEAEKVTSALSEFWRSGRHR